MDRWSRGKTFWKSTCPVNSGVTSASPSFTSTTLANEEAIARIEAGQTDEKIREVYEALKGEPKVRWKDSVKRVVGIPLDS